MSTIIRVLIVLVSAYAGSVVAGDQFSELPESYQAAAQK
jgi:hypothetical protein